MTEQSLFKRDMSAYRTEEDSTSEQVVEKKTLFENSGLTGMLKPWMSFGRRDQICRDGRYSVYMNTS